jgi:ribosomal subunit interface protein
MYLNVTTHQMHNSKSLHDYVENKMKQNINKYCKDIVSINVTFKKTSGKFRTLILINNGMGKQQINSSHAFSSSVYSSFNLAMDRVAKQLRRQKRRICDHKVVMPIRKIVS